VWPSLPKRAVVAISIDTTPHDMKARRHAVAARGGYVDSNQRVVHALNSYRATDPATSIHSDPAGNYRHHDKFSVEIEKTWSLQGTVVANPTLTVTRHCIKGGSQRTLGRDSGKRTPSKGL